MDKLVNRLLQNKIYRDDCYPISELDGELMFRNRQGMSVVKFSIRPKANQVFFKSALKDYADSADKTL